MSMRGIINASRRCFSVAPKKSGEVAIEAILKTKLAASHVDVTDVSGGCGSMYKIEVAADVFEGKKMVDQHRMVNEVVLFLSPLIVSLFPLLIKFCDLKTLKNALGDQDRDCRDAWPHPKNHDHGSVPETQPIVGCSSAFFYQNICRIFTML